MNWTISQEGSVLKQGDPCDVREFLETMIDDKTGMFLSLQEDEEEGCIYLHSEYDESLSEEEVSKVKDLGISEDWDMTTIHAIEKLLDIKVDTPCE